MAADEIDPAIVEDELAAAVEKRRRQRLRQGPGRVVVRDRDLHGVAEQVRGHLEVGPRVQHRVGRELAHQQGNARQRRREGALPQRGAQARLEQIE